MRLRWVVVCKCTAGGAGPRHAYGGEPHHGGLGCVDPGLWQWAVQEWVGSREGLRWLVSVNVSVSGAKTGEICRGSVAAALAIGYFCGESCWGLLQSRSWASAVTPTARLVLAASALLPCFFLSLFILALSISRWGKAQMGPL